jgi:type II secretory pathway component GspD/PulD (secretin)
LDHIERVEFYAVPEKMRSEVASDDVLIESLQKQIEARPNKHGTVSSIHMELDQPSNRLIVRATPDVQRFLSTLIRENGN